MVPRRASCPTRHVPIDSGVAPPGNGAADATSYTVQLTVTNASGNAQATSGQVQLLIDVSGYFAP